MSYWANFWPLRMQVDEDKHRPCIGRGPMHFDDDLQGRFGSRFSWIRYLFYEWRCGSMPNLTRHNARSADLDEVVDVVVDTGPVDALSTSLLHLHDAAVAIMREL